MTSRDGFGPPGHSLENPNSDDKTAMCSQKSSVRCWDYEPNWQWSGHLPQDTLTDGMLQLTWEVLHKWQKSHVGESWQFCILQ